MRLPALLLGAAILACVPADRNPPPPPPPPPYDPCALDAAGAAWLAFASLRTGNYEIWAARTDGTCLRQVTHDPAPDLAPTWDGTRVAYASERGGALRVWVTDLASGTEAPLDTGALGSATAPTFSPDGTLLAFEGRTTAAGRGEVYVVPATGGAPVPLEAQPGGGAGPAWAPDGQTVYFVSTRSGAYDVWAVPASGGDAVQVTVRSRIVGKPAVSPDGGALFYARTVAGSSDTEIVRHDLATGSVEAVSTQGDSEPAISWDGTRLALRSFRAGHADVVVQALDDTPAVFVTNDEPSDGAPAFAHMP
jgi:TolB protein